MTMVGRTILITGASRGIGLELARQLTAAGNQVVATCRNPKEAPGLAALALANSAVTVLELDVADDSSVTSALARIDVRTIDWLINNAGQNPRDTFEGFDAAAFLSSLNVNTVGALRVTHACMDLLRASESAKIAFISSQLGSLEIQQSGFGSLAYNTSKAALNMVARKLSFELQADKIVTAAIHPGWVRTEMGGPSAPVSVPESASGIITVIGELTAQTSGQFFRYDGTVHPW